MSFKTIKLIYRTTVIVYIKHNFLKKKLLIIKPYKSIFEHAIENAPTGHYLNLYFYRILDVIIYIYGIFKYF